MPCAFFDVEVETFDIFKLAVTVRKVDWQYYGFGFRQSGVHPSISDVEICGVRCPFYFQDRCRLGVESIVVANLAELAPPLGEGVGLGKFAWVWFPTGAR